MLWGVPLGDLQARLTRAKQVVLLKFLRARGWDVEAACAMLVKTLKILNLLFVKKFVKW